MTFLQKALVFCGATFALSLTSGAYANGCADNSQSKLQILHSSDNESSFQDPNTLEDKALNYATLARGLQLLAREECIPSLHLTAGDHTIPGPFYQASAELFRFGAPGLADIDLYNAMGLKANGMGNHEFDGGINEFATMLAAANYPFIAVNLDFSEVELAPGAPKIQIGRDAVACRPMAGKVVRSCSIMAGGEKVGLIGRAPAGFFNVISDPANTLPGLDFVGGRDPQTNLPLVSAVGQVLEQVELLEARGVKRIILLDHAQDFTADPLSASALRGIDIIVAAGSTGFMGAPTADGPFNFLRDGDVPSADYPTVRTDSEGNTVLVVNSDQLFAYIGHLIVSFDEDGNIDGVDGRSGPIATTDAALALLADELGRRTLPPAYFARRNLEAIKRTPSITSAFLEIGTTNFPLNGLRADVRSRATNLGEVVADSTLVGASNYIAANPDLNIPPVDIALKNGGGIRDSIAGPSVIRLTVQAALAFNNKLAIVEMNGESLLAAMENAVSRVPARDGRFPQVANIYLEYDASLPGVEGQTALTSPSRVVNLVVTRADGSTDTLVNNGVVEGVLADRTFVLATNDFLTTGGDGYSSLASAPKLGTTDIGEQAILEAYIIDNLGGVVDAIDPPNEPRVVRLDDALVAQ